MRYFLMQEDQLLGTLNSYDSDFPYKLPIICL